jgi:EmrB/QacA subfamily drug resistance transporter
MDGKTDAGAEAAAPDAEDLGSGIALPLLVAATLFMQNLDASVITPAIPDMAAGFGVAPVDLNIGVSTYMMTVGIFIPATGWLAQRFGARPVFLLSILIFTLASALCGMSQSLPQFVAARILQGLGGAMMVPVGRLVVLQMTPKDRLMNAIALLTWPGLVAPVLGPPVGGLIIDNVSWHWIFWLNLPLGALALLVALRIVPRVEREPGKSFDLLGFILLGAAVFCLLFAADMLSGDEVNWLLEGALALSGVALLGLGLRHIRRVEQPVLRLDALQIPTFRVTVIGGTLFRLGINAVPFLIPLLFQLAFGWSAFRAGLMLMAVFLGNILLKPFTSWILRTWGFRRVLVVNGVLNAGTILAMVLIGPTSPFPVLIALLVVAGMARSMQFTALNTIAFADVERPGMSDANTLFYTVVQLSRGVGIALGAIGWRLGGVLFPEAGEVAAFRFAFAVVGLISLLSVVECWRLAPNAGDVVARGRR